MVRKHTLMLALGLSLLTPMAAVAQDATPETITLNCDDVVPRDERMLQSISGTPPSGEEIAASTPVPLATPFVMPGSEAVSEDDLAAITETYGTLTACLNGGDFLRVASLYTDAYLRGNLTPDMIENLAQTPEADAQVAQTEFLGVREARYLSDDRIAAVVATRNPQAGELTTYSELVRGEGGWLIDREQVLETGAATPESAATPAA
ncbi:MAG: hypothetical protein QM692_12485 [Thermomicrobiales bacterium]